MTRRSRWIAVLAAVLALGVVAAAPAGAGDAPRWRDRPTGTTAGLRGLDAVSARVAWTSGSDGVVLRTLDGGAHWQRRAPAGTAALQFRDVEAFGPGTAVLLSIGVGTDARIYRTADGGRHWRRAFTNSDPNAFYDCMTFSDRRHGLVLSDPVNGKFRILRTDDGGRSWHVASRAGMLAALDGEFAFAASGTCIVSVPGTRRAWFATGGAASARVFSTSNWGRTWDVVTTPVPSGPTAGIYSLAFRGPSLGLAVGGDYTKPFLAPNAVARTKDGGDTWRGIGRAAPGDYRSGVAWVPGTPGTAIAVGPTGSDISYDRGRHWSRFDRGSFDAVACAPDGACWASGQDGQVGRLVR